jgi:hypothetical protein
MKLFKIIKPNALLFPFKFSKIFGKLFVKVS